MKYNISTFWCTLKRKFRSLTWHFSSENLACCNSCNANLSFLKNTFCIFLIMLSSQQAEKLKSCPNAWRCGWWCDCWVMLCVWWMLVRLNDWFYAVLGFDLWWTNNQTNICTSKVTFVTEKCNQMELLQSQA